MSDLTEANEWQIARIGLADGHPWTVECARWLADNFSTLAL
jgi:hypothetical protein